MNILGISAFYHDSAAALLVDGRIAAAAQEERFNREKHTSCFPENAVRFCLDWAGCGVADLDAVFFYEKPLLKFERLLETYYAFAPRGWRQFIVSMPVWLREKLFLKQLLADRLGAIGDYDRKRTPLLFSEHHLSHAAAAFYPSPFSEAAVLAIDGVGEWATATICRGEGRRLTMLREMRFPHSLGLLYSAFTGYLGFRVNSGEYKLMGLAPYGDPESVRTAEYARKIREEMVSVRDDGSICLNQRYFRYATGLSMFAGERWRKLFGFPALEPGGPLGQEQCDLACAIQEITGEVVTRMAREARRVTGLDRLCLSGGVALNCVANGELLGSGLFRDVFIQPAAGDAGGALGAALAGHHLYHGREREVPAAGDGMQGALLGPEFSDGEVLSALEKSRAGYREFDSFETLCDEVAALLADGLVIGWFQGRMEFGPRALGNRTILADPRNGEMQERLNLKIKFRESFRPFAPSVLAEDAADFFDLPAPSPYMLLVAPVKPNRRKALSEDCRRLPPGERLRCPRSDIPAVTHVDFSARVHTVERQANPAFHQLISAFKRKTGFGLVVNTSFNVRGQPIVCTPADAYECFMRTGMDALAINRFLLRKEVQPDPKPARHRDAAGGMVSATERP